MINPEGLINNKCFSTNNKLNILPESDILKYFSNADEDKLKILNYVKNKSGIYLWENKINNKKYVGSSVDLKRRLLEYYNINRLLREKSMLIHIALLKYGYSNFSLTILEFCNINNLMTRELYYFNLYLPEYNILNTPGSPSRGSGWKHTDETKIKCRISANEKWKSLEYRERAYEAQTSNIEINMFDINTKTSTTFSSIRKATRYLNIDKRYILNNIYVNKDKPVLNKYIFTILNNKDNSRFIKQKQSKNIEVIDLQTKEVKTYLSIGSAGRDLGLRQTSISTYLASNKIKPFKNRYIINLCNPSKGDEDK